MNLNTTLALVILVVTGGVILLLGPKAASVFEGQPAVDAGTLAVLETELTPDKLSQIEVRQGERVLLLSRGEGSDWTLPGRWPTRTAEVEQLVGLLTNLRSRFAPLPLDVEESIREQQLKDYGLDPPRVVVLVKAAGQRYRLALGEAEGSNRFARPTYLRLDDRPEVVRLAPGLVAALDRPVDYYQQRRLFPSERVAREADSSEKIDRLNARSLSLQEAGKPEMALRLERAGDAQEWEIKRPVHDRPDPDRLRTLLTAVPDIWAEQFVSAKPKKDLDEYGLREPVRTIEVVTPAGDTVTLLIGKRSQTKVRTATKPAPPFGPPMPPQREMLHEDYHYAKLRDNDQVFEIKADKLKDVFVSLGELRDSRLARFQNDEARKIEIKTGAGEMVLVKDKDRWKLQKPIEADADSSKVTELLNRLSGLSARDKDVLDSADPKAHGLDPPADTVTLTVEQEVKGKTGDKDKEKKTRTWTFQLGKHEADDKKLYVRVEGWARINRVDDEIKQLVERPALAYRGRRLFDFTSNQLARLEVQRGAEKITLEQDRGLWRLTAPVEAEADTATVGGLVADLGRLEVVEFVQHDPKAEDLAGYGLDKPALTAVLTFTDKDKPARTLQVGKQRGDKAEFFARLASEPDVFVIKKELRDDLDRDSLVYRPRQLWQWPESDLVQLKFQRQNEPEYALQRDGDRWKLTGPFDVDIDRQRVQRLLQDLTPLRCERYQAHSAPDPADFGLDKPYLRLTVVTAEKTDPADSKDAKEKKEPPKPKSEERVLLVGKPTAADAKSRFARLGKSEAVFVLGDALVSAIDHGALDWLDRNLLRLETGGVEKIDSVGPQSSLSLVKKGDSWQVQAKEAQFPADREVLARFLGVFGNLRAEKFAAYGPKVDLAAYGLDKPERTITVVESREGKPVEHVLRLGKQVEGTGDRYARLGDSPGVVVLSSIDAVELERGYLDFVPRDVLQFDPARLSAIRRQMGNDILELVRKEDWQLVKPQEHRADPATLDRLAEELSRLRLARVAQYPAKDLKSFGLDAPAAVLTLQLAEADGKPIDRLLKIGKPVETTEERYVLVDGSNTVGVLAVDLASRLLAEPIKFRDRNLSRFADADRVVLQRGSRKATFAKIDGTWKLTEPLMADAEQADLEDFVNQAARLRADELVADKPDDLKPYGLDRPEARWQFFLGDREVLTLLVGERKGSRAFARLPSSTLVFLLDPRLTARALGEYRSRTLWSPALDASQIETLEFGYGEQPFVLQKVNDVWQVPGKPEVKVGKEAVSDTLAALAGLRAERTVVDQGADLKLYGLDPVHLVLTIHTRTGKRVLHIGGPEGESQRRYARLPDGPRGDVFVLSEADTARIVRPLAAFKAEKKTGE
jgi:hypothetical protein